MLSYPTISTKDYLNKNFKEYDIQIIKWYIKHYKKLLDILEV